jgi:hypothetical protein
MIVSNDSLKSKDKENVLTAAMLFYILQESYINKLTYFSKTYNYIILGIKSGCR